MTALLDSIRRSAPAIFASDEPIRAELFSVERLEQYARELAQEHTQVVRRRGRGDLLSRLESNGRQLVSAYRALVQAVEHGSPVSPAAEWLLDNFHIVEEQLREIREDFPRGYYRELPKLTSGELIGYPRIFAVATGLIAHTDSRLDPVTLRRFIAAYQTVVPLTIGELWAIAITLRLALVENLRRLANKIIKSRNEREQADKFADELLRRAASEPNALLTFASDRLKRGLLPRVFVVQLMQRLREQDTAVIAVSDLIERKVQRNGVSIEQIIHAEHQKQAAAQVTVGNIITSMRLLSTLEWRDFFESVSLIDPILGADPTGAYLKMEFGSRDRYRHVIERISKRTDAPELDVARAVLALAADSAKSGPNDRDWTTHVGYYLIDAGRPCLEAVFRYHPPLQERIRRWMEAHPTLVYLSTFCLLTGLIVLLLSVASFLAGANPLLTVATAVLALIPASDLALSVLNFDLTHFFNPRLLPRMDTAHGIPEDGRTLVVVPAIISDEETVQRLIEKLEVLMLANDNEQIYFAVVGDFIDATVAQLPEDDSVLEAALAGIERLNRRHSKPGGPRFIWFHRRRLWNPSEQKWMGWERKRGKLHKLNRLLRGARDGDFIVQTATDDFLRSIRFVITLDADTQLPRDVARRLIGTALHPLNRPRVNPSLNRVTRGYGILQPRISMSLESASRSRFARVFSGNTGIDPYTTAVSDVYQDLFGEGNYTGKGLYDLDAFEQTLTGRIPENALLSHDLFESLFARAALVTDIELLDDYPASYDSYAMRLHRWARGDWQIARWLYARVPDDRGGWMRNSVPLIGRWKIFDNLRRSLTAPAIVLWFLASWTILPGSPALWTLFALITISFPVYLHVTTCLMMHPRGIPWTSHFWSVWGDIRTKTGQFLLTLLLLGHHAILMTDAVLRTLYRLLISRKHMLEWVTAAEAEKAMRSSPGAFLRFMWRVIALASIGLVLVAATRPMALVVATPFLLAWLTSPLVAYWVSKPSKRQRPSIDVTGAKLARKTARRTWRFFETFVTHEENWLPPDNYQEDPPIIAHRTSPTNIGLMLLGTVAAHDLGYVGTMELVERLESSFTSISRLSTFRGHLLNWYDTRTLEPLLPQYVSTVDSGNLAGTLITLKQFCIDLQTIPLISARTLNGLTDTIDLINEEAERLGTIRQRTEVVTIKQLRAEIVACAQLVDSAVDGDLFSQASAFASLERRSAVIDDIVGALALEHGAFSFRELTWWISALRHQLQALQRDVGTFLPWANLKLSLENLTDKDVGPDTLDRWQSIGQTTQRIPSLVELPDLYDHLIVEIAGFRSQLENVASPEVMSLRQDLDALSHDLEHVIPATAELTSRLRNLAASCDRLFHEMDFSFLLDPDRKLFTIGYNVTEQRPDNSFYDLLATEARLASFLAIAKGDVPQEHWFRMGRQLTLVGRDKALISWTGTMFEYLMPLLVMRDYDDTLLDQTYRAVLGRQIEYGNERGVPWGVSESAYSARDLHLNYQYAPFGVPGLGLKRGLVQDLVIAPYATMLAAMVDPQRAIANMTALRRAGAMGGYGFYEAIDYTPERLPKTKEPVVVRAFMAHHQGMILVGLDNTLNHSVMQDRFHSDPLVQATQLLLQERIPIGVPATRPRAEEVLIGRVSQSLVGLVNRVYQTADLTTPRTQLLSNGVYSVMITTAGSGYSSCGDRAVTRWREDVTRDNWGTFIYLRDVYSGLVWSAGLQPTLRTPQNFEVAFSEDKADFWRTDAGIVAHMEVVVSAEENAEVRQVSITNNSSRTREIELTSYAEVVLASPMADSAHPAFSNLFIETEFFGPKNALLARRRQYSPDEEPMWGVHVLVADREMPGGVQFETDRHRFVADTPPRIR